MKDNMTIEQLELVKKAKEAHKHRLELGICEEKSLQSLNIEIEHIKDPKLSEGRKNGK